MDAVTAIRRVCAGWIANDNDAIADLFDEEGVFVDPLHERPLVGREDIRKTNQAAVDELADVNIDLYWVIGDGDRACAEGRMTATVRADDSVMDFEFAMVAETSRGRITKLTEYFDTASLNQPTTNTTTMTKPVRQNLLYTTRRSPYFERTLDEGALEFGVYNHTYMPFVYTNDPRTEYDAMTEGVTLWDVGAERQAELRGPDALKFADYLAPRDLSRLAVGDCKYTPLCDQNGKIMAEAIVLRPWEDVVWFSHSDVDVSLWAYGLALAGGYDVTVAEADVAPFQVQGPLALEVLEPLVEARLADVERFKCVVTELAGVEVVVSNTGWSKEAGYEVYPVGTGRAVEAWDSVREAGRKHGMLVTGPNLNRAVEQGILDTQYATNSDMDLLEAGLGGFLDLDENDFIGRDALLKVREQGPARKTVGLVSDREEWPLFEGFWPLDDASGEQVGIVRWAVWSYALDRNIAVALVDAGVAGDAVLTVRSPTGDHAASVHKIPFV
jgi:glycine cleavage system aminomethyltransferase T/ketosteroid isomerase-like protein